MNNKQQETPKGGSQTEGGRNEGEGNRTAAREYNTATEEFAKSGRVEESGKRAKHALEGDERAELERAEEIGKSKIREEDPAIARKRH
jgi:hypothetical protein